MNISDPGLNLHDLLDPLLKSISDLFNGIVDVTKFVLPSIQMYIPAGSVLILACSGFSSFVNSTGSAASQICSYGIVH